ncbi:Mth938-like domain-containing protein [Gammaproteobacteria bacterium]|nr:Mth938-like domain-containing protein [Gammaproteobacteria bacterium]
MCPRLSIKRFQLAPLIESVFYLILRGMPLAEDIVTSRHRLSSYSDVTVSINEREYRQSLILTADSLLSPWPVTGLDQLSGENLAPIFASKPAVVLLGTGMRQQFPKARIFGLFGEQGIGLEVMDNGALCRTFNILVAEDRAVTAAIILPG